MTDDDRLAIEAFRDGELGGLARRRMERRLRRSPELRAELDELSRLSSLLVADPREPDEGEAPASLGTWQAIAGALPAVDSQILDEPRLGPAPARGEEVAPAAAPGFQPWRWATAFAAAAALVLVLSSGRETDVPPGSGLPASGSSSPLAAAAPLAATATATNPIAVDGAVRYLDTAGRSVMVIEEVQEDLTILWMMDEA